jgi:hypothetical protein
MEFLGYIISRNGICMDPCKVWIIVDWVTPIFVRDVQCLLKFTNFHRHFIAHYFTWLTKKYQHFSRGVEAENAF